jgi:hypothetical protein
VARAAALHVEVLVWLLAARRLLSRAGLEPTLHRLGDGTARWGRGVAGPEVVATANRVQRLVGRGTCLEESVALAAVLARHGRRPEIVVGARRAREAWAAHAWTVVDGVRYDQAPSDEHTALASYSIASGWSGRPIRTDR